MDFVCRDILYIYLSILSKKKCYNSIYIDYHETEPIVPETNIRL